jgi:hypothetical protein
MGEESKEDVWCVAIGPRLVIGDAPSRPEDYLARAEKKLAGFAASETFRKDVAALEKASSTPVLWFALSGSLRGIVGKMQASEDVGLEAVSRLPSDVNPFSSALVARTQFGGERFVTEMIASAAASAAKAIDPAWLEPVPAGTMFVFSSAFDGAAAGKGLREMLAKDEQVAASLAALEQKLGFGFERMFGRLGPGMTVYAAAPAGLGLPEARLWIDCDDAAAFTSDFEALFNALGETLPGLQAKTKTYKVKTSDGDVSTSYTTLTLPQSWQQIPMINPAPSFTPVGKKLVFGLSSMDMKSELKRVHGASGEPIVPGSNPLGAYGFQLPADARTIVVMDWAKLLGGIVGTVKAFAGIAGPETMSFDLNKLPPPELFAQYFKPTFFYSKSATAGLYRRNEASFGPETWLGLGALFVGVAQTMEMGMEPAGRPDNVLPLEPAGGGQ